MHVYQSMCLIETRDIGAFHELTDILTSELKKSGIKNGILTLSVLHTTCAILMQENDRSVHNDSKAVLENVAPEHLDYEHTYEGVQNARGHQLQMLIGNSQMIPVKKGSLVLGTWQMPFLIELFKPMERKIFVTIIGE